MRFLTANAAPMITSAMACVSPRGHHTRSSIYLARYIRQTRNRWRSVGKERVTCSVLILAGCIANDRYAQ